MDVKTEPTPTSPVERRSPSVMVRASRDSDVPAMLAIYLHHIRRGVDPDIAGEFETPDAEDIKRRRKTMQRRKMPHIVAEEAGRRRRLRLCGAVPQAPGLSLHGQAFDLCA